MDKQTQEIINKYQYDKKTRKYSNKHFFRDHKSHSQVNSNEDVDRAYNEINNCINYFMNVKFDLVNDDIERLEQALGKYEIAIHKVISCFDNHLCDFNYSSEELMQLINNWDTFEEGVSKIHQRKIYQD
ncbi:hypothetical protein J2T13_005248 [Paenibacillus sp. DS2015]|uniref:hypothetical protein n=1 Tax=Paenibacillus sp. DS2015 TaxID=3373917 RepID=UPI003D20A884